jgi:hypothetical protein
MFLAQFIRIFNHSENSHVFRLVLFFGTTTIYFYDISIEEHKLNESTNNDDSSSITTVSITGEGFYIIKSNLSDIWCCTVMNCVEDYVVVGTSDGEIQFFGTYSYAFKQNNPVFFFFTIY